MKAVKVIAPASFASFLTAMTIPFMWSYGIFYILNTGNADKFKAYCEKNGVREAELANMSFTSTEIEMPGLFD